MRAERVAENAEQTVKAEGEGLCTLLKTTNQLPQ